MQICDNKLLLLLHSNTWNHLTVCKQIINSKPFPLDRNTWNHLTVYKNMNSGSFKKFIKKMRYKSYLFNIYAWRGFGIK